MADFDVVVIGAGNGGLTSALTLAKKGLKVLLLERHNIPGGCATSFVRGRFEFEVALHQLSGMGTEQGPGPLRTTLGKLGVADKLEFVEMENLYRVASPGSVDLTLGADRAAAAATLKERFPEEAEGIDRFFDLVYNFCMQMLAGVFFRDPEFSKEKHPIYFEYALKPAQDVLDHYFKDPLLKLAVGIYWSYTGLPPGLISFTDLALVLFMYIELKPFHIKGGSQALSSALLDEFLTCGGQARFSCGAGKILVSDGRVNGVVTEHKDEITADYVVSNAGPLTTYVDLMERESVPESEMKTIGSRSIGISAFTVYLGLDCEPGDLGIHEATNFICRSADFDRAYALMKTMDAAEMALFTCFDVSDPDFSPPGACQAALVTLQYADPWLSIPPTRYAEAKYQYAGRMLDLAETVFPGIRDHIEEVETATPLTHMRYLGHPGGAIYGFDSYAKDSRLFASPRCPVKGLYFVGAWASGGGFQPTLDSGASTARAILKDRNR